MAIARIFRSFPSFIWKNRPIRMLIFRTAGFRIKAISAPMMKGIRMFTISLIVRTVPFQETSSLRISAPMNMTAMA